MSITLALAVYFIVWWITLFAILPLHLGPEGERDAMHEASGAPASPRLGLKFVITTIIATAIFGLIYAVIAYKLIRLDDIPFLHL